MSYLHYLSRLTLLQLLLMAILVTILSFQLTQPDNRLPLQPSITEGKLVDRELPTLKLPGIRELEQYAAISDRPLFHSTRAPQDITTPLTASSKPSKRNPKQDWILTGIIINGSESLALFNAIGQKKSESLRNGMKLGDWELNEITPQSVKFIQDDQSIEMLLIQPTKATPKQSTTSSSLFRSQSQYGKIVRPLEEKIAGDNQ